MSQNTVPDTDPRNWTEDLVSGNQVIDQQHRELLRRFEMLEDAVKEGEAFKEVKLLAAFLQRYVLTHFNTEEQEMLAGHYPGSALHAAEHDQCKNRIFQFKKFIETERDREKIVAVAYSMLGLWVRDHILNHDIQFIQYIKEKGKEEITINVNYQWSPEISILWTSDFQIGVDVVDEQHRNLVKWTEYVQDAKLLSRQEIHDLLDFIHGFIVTHFTDEEILMIDINFPHIQTHTEQHSMTRTKFFEVKKWFTGDLDPRDMQAMVLELFMGYVKHIQQYDIQFKQYLHK